MAYSGAYHREQHSEPTTEAKAGRMERTEAPQPLAPRSRPSFDLGSLFQKTEAVGWETDDLLLALVLYLMYRESGDMDLLIMLAVMLLT